MNVSRLFSRVMPSAIGARIAASDSALVNNSVFRRFFSSSAPSAESGAAPASTTAKSATEAVTDPRLLGPRQYPSKSKEWYSEWAYVFLIFGVTGSTMAYFTRYYVRDVLGFPGTFIQGPPEFRAVYWAHAFPIYTMTLVLMGNLFGRGVYFNNFAKKMLKRSMPLWASVGVLLGAYAFFCPSGAKKE